MADGTPIGSIPVLITGDWSGLQQALQQATADAASAAGDIASAFNSAAGGADSYDQAIQKVIADFVQGKTTWDEYAAALQAVDASFAGLAEAASSVASAQSALAPVAQQAADGEQQMADAITQVASQASGASASLNQFTEQEQQAGQAAASGADNVGQLMSAFSQVAGISLSIAALKEFTEAAIETFAATEKAQIAFDYLTGSAQMAGQVMAGLKGIADELALPTDQVVQFAQKLTAAGASVDELDVAIRAAADAAAGTGNSFDALATKIYNLAESVNIPTKSLKELGITITDLAAANGETVADIKAQWADLTIDQKIDAINAALGKFQDASKATADSTAGDIQRMKNEWNEGLQAIGGQLASTVKGLGDGFKDLVLFIAAGVTNVIDLAKGLGTALAAIFDAIGTASAGFAKAFAAAMSGDFSGVKDAAVNTVKQIEDEVGAQISVYMDELKRDNDSLKTLYAQLFNPAPLPKGGGGNTLPPAGGGTEDTSQFDAQIKEFQKLEDASALLLNQTKSNYSDYLATLADGGKSASAIVSALTALINKAEVDQQGMVGGFDSATQDLIERLQNVRDMYKDFASDDSLAKIGAQWQAAIEKIADETDALSDKFDAMANKAGEALAKAGTGFALLTTAGTTLVGQLEVVPGIFDRIASAGNTTWANLLDALNKTGVAADGAVAKLSGLLPAIDQVFTNQLAKLPQVEGEWAKYGAAIQKAAAQGVPAAINAWNDYIAALQRLGQPIAAATAKLAELKQNIDIGVAAGQNVGNLEYQYEKLKIGIDAATQASKQMSQGEIIDLANSKLALQAHIDLVNLLSNTYKQVQTDIINSFQSLGKGFADAILSGQSFGSVMTSVFKQLEKQILEDLVGGALKALGESLVSLIGGAASGSSVLSTLFGSIKSSVSGMSGILGSVQGASQAALDWSAKAATSAVNAAVDAGEAATTAAQTGTQVATASSNMAQGASSMAGASSSISSSVVGIIGAVASVIGAIASVGTFVESLVENHKLATIEENTRKTAILTQEIVTNNASIFNQEYLRFGEILNAVQDVNANLSHVMEGEGNIFNRLGDLWTTLQDIDSTMGMAADSLGRILSLLSTSAAGLPSQSPSAGSGGASVADLITAVNNVTAAVQAGFASIADAVATLHDIAAAVKEVTSTLVEGLTNINISAQKILAELQLMEADTRLLDQLTAIGKTLTDIDAGIASLAGSGGVSAPTAKGSEGKQTDLTDVAAILSDIAATLSGIASTESGAVDYLSNMAAILQSVSAVAHEIDATLATMLAKLQEIGGWIDNSWGDLDVIKDLVGSIYNMLLTASGWTDPFGPAPNPVGPEKGGPVTLPPGSGGGTDQANAMIHQLQTLSGIQSDSNTALQGMLLGQGVGNTALRSISGIQLAQQQSSGALNQIQSTALQYTGSISKSAADAVTVATQIDLTSADTNTLLQNILNAIGAEAKDVHSILGDADEMVKQLTALVGYFQQGGFALPPTLHLSLPQTPGATTGTGSGTNGGLSTSGLAQGMTDQLQTISGMQAISNTALQGIQAAQSQQVTNTKAIASSAGATVVQLGNIQSTMEGIGAANQASLAAVASTISSVADTNTAATVAMGEATQSARSSTSTSISSATDKNTSAIVAMGEAVQYMGSSTAQLVASLPPPTAIVGASAPSGISTVSAASTGLVNSGGSIGTININVSGAQSPRQTADAIFKELRQRSPVFSQAVTRGGF